MNLQHEINFMYIRGKKMNKCRNMKMELDTQLEEFTQCSVTHENFHAPGVDC